MTKHRQKPEKRRTRTYVVANPFNSYGDPEKPVKIYIEDTTEVGLRMAIHFVMDFRGGKTKDGWIWIDSWERAIVWADQRVGLNTGEPVVHCGTERHRAYVERLGPRFSGIR